MFVFISYSSIDSNQSSLLSSALKERKILHFLDKNQIQVGDDIPQVVLQNLEIATHFVLLLSPAGEDSSWVNFELGVATGLKLQQKGSLIIIPWMVYPLRDVPSFIATKKHVKTLEEVLSAIEKYQYTEDQGDWTKSFVRGYGYSSGGRFARALRLIGAADEFFPASRVHIISSSEPYELPDELLHTKSEVLSRLKRENAEKKAIFFNGPHTRLFDYHISDIDPDTEDKQITLFLSPIDWYDYSVVRWHTERANENNDRKWIEQHVKLDEVAATGRIRQSRLPNILDTATTLITSDGHLLYSARGERVSAAPNFSTSAVAENIHQKKDLSLSDASNAVLPSPFRAAIRGIAEEISPQIEEIFVSGRASLRCLGLSFDLAGYQPDMLFLAILPLSLEQTMTLFKEHAGVDFFEGKLMHADIEDQDSELSRCLGHDRWTGGGKASVIRAIEYLDALALKRRISRRGVILQLLKKMRIQTVIPNLLWFN